MNHKWLVVMISTGVNYNSAGIQTYETYDEAEKVIKHLGENKTCYIAEIKEVRYQ